LSTIAVLAVPGKRAKVWLSVGPKAGYRIFMAPATRKGPKLQRWRFLVCSVEKLLLRENHPISKLPRRQKIVVLTVPYPAHVKRSECVREGLKASYWWM